MILIKTSWSSFNYQLYNYTFNIMIGSWISTCDIARKCLHHFQRLSQKYYQYSQRDTGTQKHKSDYLCIKRNVIEGGEIGDIIALWFLTSKHIVFPILVFTLPPSPELLVKANICKHLIPCVYKSKHSFKKIGQSRKNKEVETKGSDGFLEEKMCLQRLFWPPL